MSATIFSTMLLVLMIAGGALMADAEIPTVTLGDLARNSTKFFEKPVRLIAVLEQWT